jgi:hypothetical protein
MLRITIDHNPQVLTFRLEGRLEGPWVALLADCWSTQLARAGGRQLCADLNGVTFISPDGKAILARMCKERADSLLATQ